jgi:hypothetical protein
MATRAGAILKGTEPDNKSLQLSAFIKYKRLNCVRNSRQPWF